MSSTHYRKRNRRKRSGVDRAKVEAEALARIQSGNSVANFDDIFTGFEAKGIPAAEILPRENVLTFTAWRAKGRTVRRGEHGVKVTTWVETETDEVDPETGANRKGRRPVTATVFHVSQTAELTDSPAHDAHGSDSQPPAAAPSSDSPAAPATPTPAPARPTATPTVDPDRLRQLADGLTAKISHLSRPLSQNWTAKRGSQLTSRLHDAGNMKRTQTALRMLADLHERGACPWSLAALRTVSAVAPLVARRIEQVSHGYHPQYATSREYIDQSSPAKALQELIDGGSGASAADDLQIRQQLIVGKIRQSQIDGFFPTPKQLADMMVRCLDVRPGHEILEPSAGMGDLAVAVLEARSAVRPPVSVIALERAPLLVEYLETVKEKWPDRLEVINADCLEAGGEVDRIIMNPPYEKGQDAEHVQHCFGMLKPGGRMVALVGEGVMFRQDAKATAFREWLYNSPDVAVDHDEKLTDAFNGPSVFNRTGVAVRLLVIDKVEP